MGSGLAGLDYVASDLVTTVDDIVGSAELWAGVAVGMVAVGLGDRHRCSPPSRVRLGRSDRAGRPARGRRSGRLDCRCWWRPRLLVRGERRVRHGRGGVVAGRGERLRVRARHRAGARRRRGGGRDGCRGTGARLAVARRRARSYPSPSCGSPSPTGARAPVRWSAPIAVAAIHALLQVGLPARARPAPLLLVGAVAMVVCARVAGLGDGVLRPVAIAGAAVLIVAWLVLAWPPPVGRTPDRRSSPHEGVTKDPGGARAGWAMVGP